MKYFSCIISPVRSVCEPDDRRKHTMCHAVAFISVVLWQTFWTQSNVVGHTAA